MDIDSRNLIISFAKDFVIRDIGCERNGSDSYRVFPQTSHASRCMSTS